MVGLGEFLGVAAIGLHPVAGLLGNQRRRDDLAVDAQLGQLPVECIPGGPGLVADLEILGAALRLVSLTRPERNPRSRCESVVPF